MLCSLSPNWRTSSTTARSGTWFQLGPQQPDRAEHLQAFERPDDNSRLAPRQPRSDGCVEDATYRTDSLGSINPVALKVKEHDPSPSRSESPTPITEVDVHDAGPVRDWVDIEITDRSLRRCG